MWGELPSRIAVFPQGAVDRLAEAQSAVKSVIARRTGLHAAAVAAEERAAAAKRRLPEVDAGKKAAAAARVRNQRAGPLDP